MLDRNDILEGLRRSGPILSAFIGSIPEAQMNRRRADGVWTIAEHAGHLARVQPMLLERIRRFRNEAQPRFTPYLPDADENEDPPVTMASEEVLQTFNRHRGQQVAELEAADDATWTKTARHPEYVHYSLHILARHILMHDHWHMYRMEELWLTRDAYLTQVD